ncbi:DASS family sodium-coupled anion symporter [Haliea sp. AH-315-K21]|uniref:Anion transporter n=1 Tax=SAR86 cluster bacterium TaxID=2030880 RepID=A0A2A5C8P4_9GAMM|nr:DASS family sodium-coupled anion symporter [Haliea sp. AH-315-K21]PCJ40239.1 MAG: anion transporter [SAR86 cluster bacterium]
MNLTDSSKTLRKFGLFAGPAVALIIFLLMPEQYSSISGESISMEHSTRTIAAVVGWMAVWWITEAIPVYATALIPLALLPAIGGLSIREVSAPYANEVIYLYLGGFVVALTMQRWQLHKRVAFSALRLAGNTPRRIIGTFMGIAAAGSMWISNTATTMMLLPVVLSVIALVAEREDMPSSQENRNLSTGLLLGTAYGAIIGGIGTIVGTPPNVFVVSFLQSQLDIEISFARWMSFGVPIVLVFTPLGWLILTRWILPVGEKPVEGIEELIDREQKNLGPMTTPEWRVLWVFLTMATLWITRPLISDLAIGGIQPFSGLSDSGVAIIAALSLFCIPAGDKHDKPLVNWETAQKLPWGMLLLYGGGLSLAAMMDRYGVSGYVGSLAIGMVDLPQVVIVLSVLAIMMLLTELTSNTATAATLIPIFAAIAPAFGMNPLWLIIPAGLGASCAFMLPVATPPNAIIFSTERFTIGQMVRAGIWFNLLGMLVIGVMIYWVAMPLLGVD